jgi:hypothetical protein
MEVLFHLVFILIKVAILSCLYGLVFLIIIRLIKKRLNHSSFKNWMILSVSSFAFLLVFMNTNWGDHGLGDYARIPIGEGKEIEQINYSGMYIRPEGHENETLSISSYYLDKEYCFGTIEKSGMKFIWHLRTNEIEKFKSEIDYLRRLQSLNLKRNQIVIDFKFGYNRHWNGWRFWLLP